MPDKKIRRALISVYDKTGIVDFARALVDEFGIEVISTGGTAALLRENHIPVTMVEEVTGFPEMMDGRVKTLHPRIHAGILADRDNPDHMRQLAEQGIEPIDMVVVNLYPFEETIAQPDCTFEQAIEMIDIGGPCLLRAAAKNHKHVLTVPSADNYDFTLLYLRGDVDTSANDGAAMGCALEMHAWRVFRDTCDYDAQIAEWMSRSLLDERCPSLRVLSAYSWGVTRYGENPHQSGELLQLRDDPGAFDLTTADACAANDACTAELSFNNYTDANAALDLCAELSRQAAAGAQLCHERVWHRHPAGENVAPASCRCSTKWDRLAEEGYTRRNLPHIQTPGRTYFVTFKVREGELPEQAREIVLDSCRYWHGQKMSLHVAVVMPDHVHMLLTPYHDEGGETVSLGELLHSIKSYSAKQINKVLGRTGPVWLDENWDRIMRHEQEFRETCEYIDTNPGRAGLGSDYSWVWQSDAGFEAGGVVTGSGAEALHRQDAGATSEETAHRQDAGATSEETAHRQDAGATSEETAHRQDAGATHEEASGQPDLGGTPSTAVCVFIKHTNACGVGVCLDPVEAYQQAYLGDPNAAMGGILACDFEITSEFAEAVMDTYGRWGKQAGAGGFFVEVWLAPTFQEEAVELIRTRKKWGERVRLLDVGDLATTPDPEEMDFKRIAGGMLVQNRDLVGLNEYHWKVVTERQPTEQEMADLRLAWLVCKHTKSNAITVCKDGRLIGNGAGQMSRVMSCRIATWLAKENGHEDQLNGSVAASDAFFPFRDGPDILADAGVRAIIQPGGSKRDADTIAACNERGLAMIFTGTRHFKH